MGRNRPARHRARGQAILSTCFETRPRHREGGRRRQLRRSSAARRSASSARAAAARASPRARSCSIVAAPGRIVGGAILLSAAPPDGGQPVDLAGARSAAAAQIRGHPRPRDRDDLPGADVVAEPGAHHRRPDRRGAPAAPPDEPKAEARARAIELLDQVEIPAPGAGCRPLPLRVLRRHAAARDDRHGARLQSDAPDRRRADDGARRHHPGRDPRPDEAPAERATAWR